MGRLKIGLLNDSFPPIIDGVAQTVRNYASVLQSKYGNVTVVTPRYKGVTDNYPFDVYRYPSVSLGNMVGYRAGNPFDPVTIAHLYKAGFNLLHVHAPFASSVLARTFNHQPRLPVVFTYHTKFDIDIAKRVPIKPFQKVVEQFALSNINAADEVWAVTEGCGESLRRFGYRGGFCVMENGTDFKYGRADGASVAALRQRYGIRDDELIFLFVGRMMWYKNTRLILDTLRRLKTESMSFRAFMVGDGMDADDIKAYATRLDLDDRVVFTGAIYDREELRTYYCMADLFLFPSTYDTSGIVVKEAAACDCPALLVEGSCAAEGVTHGVNGFLARENADSCAQVLSAVCRNRGFIREVGENAGRQLYLSWDTAVDRAYRRYVEILKTPRNKLPYNSKTRWV